MRLGGAAVCLLVVLSACSGPDDSSPEPSTGRASTSASVDPLSMEEPVKPDLGREGPFTARQGMAVVDHFFAAWRYSVGTGFETAWRDVGGRWAVGCLDLFGEFETHVADAGHLVVVDEPEVTLRRRTAVRRIRDDVWSAGFLVDVRIPERRVVDEDGAELEVLEPCETQAVVVVASQARFGPQVALLDEPRRTA
ncbi:hypothetical protein [Nocardioides sediminis]|uniref:hypothetical protein n=1 Tax=Nocardioides sediminis TaxID=433648 RepID=UPI000D301FC3|nr:hypothetical protein [Nocardioides sediminis]